MRGVWHRHASFIPGRRLVGIIRGVVLRDTSKLNIRAQLPSHPCSCVVGTLDAQAPTA